MDKRKFNTEIRKSIGRVNDDFQKQKKKETKEENVIRKKDKFKFSPYGRE